MQRGLMGAAAVGPISPLRYVFALCGSLGRRPLEKRFFFSVFVVLFSSSRNLRGVFRALSVNRVFLPGFVLAQIIIITLSVRASRGVYSGRHIYIYIYI